MDQRDDCQHQAKDFEFDHEGRFLNYGFYRFGRINYPLSAGSPVVTPCRIL
jgi:hypothetical protein